jgi:hypothetical protein
MPVIQLSVRDETATGRIINEISISISNELTTVKDLIEARVISEVETYNNKLPEVYRGLVQPRDSEVALNGYKLKERKKVDAEKQVYTALDAFQQNGFFVLIDNKQAESLDEQLFLNNDTVVSFVKLTPLVGG